MRLVIRITYGDGYRDNFDEQLELVKSTGAQWDPGTKTWLLWLGADVARDAEALTTLFKAASSYGTYIQADARRSAV